MAAERVMARGYFLVPSHKNVTQYQNISLVASPKMGQFPTLYTPWISVA